jgi:hypothetical protein
LKRKGVLTMTLSKNIDTVCQLFDLDKTKLVTLTDVYKALIKFAKNVKEPNGVVYACRAVEDQMDGDLLDCQLNYVLINGSDWHGEEARNAKALMKLWQNQYKKQIKERSKSCYITH